MLLPRPACNDTAVITTWDSEGVWCTSVCHTGLSASFGLSAIPRLCRGLSAGEVNPDVRAGSCSAQQGNGLLRLQRVRADEPAETHGQTGRQAGRPRDRQERGEGATACFGSLDPLRIEPSPLLVSTQNPHPLVSRFAWGESRARRGVPGVLFPVSLRMTARCHPRPTSATTGRAAPWACGAVR